MGTICCKMWIWNNLQIPRLNEKSSSVKTGSKQPKKMGMNEWGWPHLFKRRNSLPERVSFRREDRIRKCLIKRWLSPTYIFSHGRLTEWLTIKWPHHKRPTQNWHLRKALVNSRDHRLKKTNCKLQFSSLIYQPTAKERNEKELQSNLIKTAQSKDATQDLFENYSTHWAKHWVIVGANCWMMNFGSGSSSHSKPTVPPSTLTYDTL